MKEKIREVLYELCGFMTTIKFEGMTDEIKLQVDRATTAILALMPQVDGNTSDGYHTFNELYEHRVALFLYALRQGAFHTWYVVPEHFEGWDLIVAYTVPNGEQISYHVPISQRPYYPKPTGMEPGPANHIWDGHTPADVINRLNNLPAAPQEEV